MAQGQFTKEEAMQSAEALQEIMAAMPKSKIINFAGHFNDIFLFLAAAKQNAPTEMSLKVSK